MPLSISRLRRWFAISAIVAVSVVVGAYLYARHRVQNALKQVPEKIALNIQQSSEGFAFSGSLGVHTLFKVQARKEIQFAHGGHYQLHDVAITLYGRDSSRFDQIYGSDFEYDPASGDVTAKGEVQIDLEANPSGGSGPDQAAPKELKDPIHLRTSGLVFNQKTGNASTREKVEFRIPQASGSAVGVSYVSKTDTLTLDSQLQIAFTGKTEATMTAAHGTITKDPRTIVLQSVRLQQGDRQGQSDEATLFLNQNNVVERVLGSNVSMELAGKQSAQIRADHLETFIEGTESSLRRAVLSGNVRLQGSDGSRSQANAGRAILSFAGGNVLNKVRAEDNVKIVQLPEPGAPAARSQTVELSAPAMDFFVAGGERLTRAETFGTPQIGIRPASPNAGETLITAEKLTAQFDALGQLSLVRGAPNARIVNRSPGQPDRVSTSASLEASFAPGQGMESVVQKGNVTYTDGARQAWADFARYTAGNQMFELSGSPRVLDENMVTTARLFRLNRATGDGYAEGDVKSTYNDLKPQPNGALLAASSPIHVTAENMTVHRDPAIALYTGDARLWQNANVVSASSIKFDRNERSMVANGSAAQPVSTVLVAPAKHGQVTPATIVSDQLSYVDSERKVHFSGGVTVKAADFTLSSEQMNAFLRRESPASGEAAATSPMPETGNLDRIVAQGNVIVTQPGRRATGNQLTYTAAEEKFVLTGGPPSIFDAERGKITGVSLTLFRTGDRVLVEGTDTSPSVTQTQVAR